MLFEILLKLISGHCEGVILYENEVMFLGLSKIHHKLPGKVCAHKILKKSRTVAIMGHPVKPSKSSAKK